MSSAVAEREERALVALTPMDMLNQAVSQGANIEVLEKLMTLQERWERNQARKAFDEAMSAAKSEIPVIVKNRTVDFTSTKGRTNYRHEDLAEIARTVDPILTKYGLSYRYRTDTQQGVVSVTCIVSHRDGHSEENTLSAGRDESGNKNNIQAVGSTITYLQRYTLKAALGLAASNDDDAKATTVGGPISGEQVADLRQKIIDADADLPRFLRVYGIESIDELPTTKFAEAIAKLDVKIAKAGAPS